jgi:hypothetical protein
MSHINSFIKQSKSNDSLSNKLSEYDIIENKWESDDIINCNLCHQMFSFFNRRHHCRSCGKIFCSACIKFNVSVPEYMDLLTTESRHDTKICNICLNKIKTIEIDSIFNFFLCCDLFIVISFMPLSSQYNTAGRKYLKLLKNIQFKLSLTEIEKQVIFLNRFYLFDHYNYFIPVLQTIDINPKFFDTYSRRIIPCQICLNKCELSYNHITQLIIINNIWSNVFIAQLILYFMSLKRSELIDLYMPFIINYLTDEIFSFLMKEYKKSNYLLDLYWYITTYCIKNKDVYIKEIQDAIFDNNLIVPYLRIKSLCVITKEQLVDMKHYKSHYSPLYSNLEFASIDIANITNKKSNTAPLLIPYLTKDNTCKKILYKPCDIRKDQIINNLIIIIKNILLNYDIDIPIVSYKSRPTTNTSGYIEIVNNAKTVQELINNNVSVITFLINNNKLKTVHEIKMNYLKSVSLYCVISYIFGIGDRNMDNLMLSSDGLLFQIDMTYIFGQTPNILHYDTKKIKITKFMIDFLGDSNCEYYKYFIKLSSDIYNICKQYKNLFISLLSVLPRIDPSMAYHTIIAELDDRLHLNKHFGVKIENDIDNYQCMVIDLIYSSKSLISFL